MKSKLILITVLALGSMAHAQGFVSNLSVGAGFQGIFPGSTFTKSIAETCSSCASSQDTTNSLGGLGDVRYDFGRHSALDLTVTVNRNSELYEDPTQLFSRVQTNNVEVIGSYIVRLPSKEHLSPYFLIGGGVVRFSPNNNFSVGGVPSSQMKPAFAYGFGADYKFSDHWAVRLQYRGLVRSEPDFGLLNNASTPFGTGLKVHVAEPSIAVIYHF